MKAMGAILALVTAAGIFYGTGLDDWSASADPGGVIAAVREYRGGPAGPTPASGKLDPRSTGRNDVAASQGYSAASTVRLDDAEPTNPDQTDGGRILRGALSVADRIIRFHTEQVE